MSESNQTLRRIIAALIAAAAVPATPVALAQNAAQAGNEDSASAVPEIIVTAQKREQNLQDVPIVVTAVSGQLLQDTGVKDIKDLTILTPGLTVTSTTSEAITTARIRGIGTVGDNPGLESSVGVVIDGVYRPRNGVSFGDLGELERIEVLKGPQGTLFGKNTSAGVINILTRQPEFDFKVNGEVSGGNYNSFEAAASVTGPLVSDKVAGRLYAGRGKRDGFYDVSIADGPRNLNEDSDRDFYTVRGQLLIRPAETLDIRLIADYSDRDENCCATTQINSGASGAIINALSPDTGVALPADPFARQAFLNRPMPQNIEDRGVSAELNWDLAGLGGATFTSISSYRNWESVMGLDADFSTADIWFRASDGRFGNEFKQLTQELRLAGQADRLNWLVGAFYSNEELDSASHLAYGSDFEAYYSLLFSGGRAPTLINTLTGRAPGTAYAIDSGQQDAYSQDSDSYALFTNNSYSFTEQLEGTIGLRYTNEQKSLDSAYTNIGGNGAACAASRARFALVNGALATAPPGTVASYYGLGCGTYADPAFNNFSSTQDFDESEMSGTAKLAYRFSDDFMSYLSYARGYKAGGFNLDRERIVSATLGPADPASQADPDTSFPSEEVDSYELGGKSTWFGGSLLLNTAVFYQEYQNFQLNTFTGISFIVASIPEVTSQGVDLDFVWAPMRALSFQGGVTYAETEYGDFAPGPGVSPRLPGNQVSFAPKWSGSLAATYSQPLGANLQWRSSVGAKTTSSYNTGSDLAPQKMQGGFTLLNARLGLGAQSGLWTVEAWGLNLTDKEYYQVVIDAPLQTGVYDAFLGAPRTYGLTLRMSF
jgi:iron complex outermembrane recepter protein